MCLYAQGGVGKTTQIYKLAKYLWDKGEQKTIVFSADGGGLGTLKPGVDAGFIEFYQMDAMPSPFVWMDKVVGGNRPVDVFDPKTKWDPIDFEKEKIGALCNEGLTSWGQILLDWARDEHAEGRQVGQMEGGKLFFKDGDMKLGANTPAHYGIGQSYLGTFVARSRRLWAKGLPNILWTALEQKAELKGGSAATFEAKSMAYGPKLPGQAATGQCIPWFTHVIHLDVVKPSKQADGSIKGERKLFLDQHYAENDPTPYLAKVNVNPEGKMPMVLGADLGLMLGEMERAEARALEAALRKG